MEPEIQTHYIPPVSPTHGKKKRVLLVVSGVLAAFCVLIVAVLVWQNARPLSETEQIISNLKEMSKDIPPLTAEERQAIVESNTTNPAGDVSVLTDAERDVIIKNIQEMSSSR